VIHSFVNERATLEATRKKEAGYNGNGNEDREILVGSKGKLVSWRLFDPGQSEWTKARPN
jgi:hypothetical protein